MLKGYILRVLSNVLIYLFIIFRKFEIWGFLFQVLYCDACRESCHPKRGPLAAHNLGPPRGSWQSSGSKGSRPEGTPICNDHNGEAVTLYCALCKIAICALCLRDRHAAHPHDVLPLAAACKAQKVSKRSRTVSPMPFSIRVKFLLSRLKHTKAIHLIDDRDQQLNEDFFLECED